MDTHDLNEWKRSELGIYAYAKKMGRSVTPQEELHLKHSLAAAKRFRKEHFYRKGATSFDDPKFLLHPRTEYSHLRIVNFGSEAFNSTHKGWWHDGERIRMDQGPVHGRGDGTVMDWAWACCPGGLPYRKVLSDRIHIQLLMDEKLIQVVADLLGVQYSTPSCEDRKKKTPSAYMLGMVSLLVGVLAWRYNVE